MKNWFNEREIKAPGLFKSLQNKRVAILNNIGVAHGNQGEGHGTRLIQQFLIEAKQYNAEVALLIADEDEPQKGGFDLVAWYERLGFKPIGTSEGYPVMMRVLIETKTASAQPVAPVYFYIEVPKASREHFWDEPPEGNLEFWAFKDRPRAFYNQKIIFKFDGQPVAEAKVLKIEDPGQSKCDSTGKYEKHWKVFWSPKEFKKYKTADTKNTVPKLSYSRKFAVDVAMTSQKAITKAKEIRQVSEDNLHNALKAITETYLHHIGELWARSHAGHSLNFSFGMGSMSVDVDGKDVNFWRGHAGKKWMLNVYNTLKSICGNYFKTGCPRDLKVSDTGIIQFIEHTRKQAQIQEDGILAVDLDGTLAEEIKPFDPLVIGPPIPAMVEKIKAALADGRHVVIFTARLAEGDQEQTKALIREYTKAHIGVALESTNEKSPLMVEFWDDKAKGVEKDTGEFKTASSEETATKFVLFDTVTEAKQEFMHGACHILTYVLNQLLGWPCFLFNCDEGCMHSAVKSPDGRYLDAAGYVTLEQLNKRYGISLKVTKTDPAGLDALYGIDEGDEDGENAEYSDAKLYAKLLLKRLGLAKIASLTTLPTDAITPTEDHLDEDIIKNIEDDLDQGHQLDPITVYRFKGKYLLTDGHHRLEVARRRGMKEVSVIIREWNDPPPPAWVNKLNAPDGGGQSDQWAVFKPNQIKSAIGNNGNFSRRSPKITASDDLVKLAAIRCTRATLEAFGIKGKSPAYDTDVTEALQAAGYTVIPLTDEPLTTVKNFVRMHPKGNFYISTHMHAMALIDGVLTDTMNKGPDNRQITGVMEVGAVKIAADHGDIPNLLRIAPEPEIIKKFETLSHEEQHKLVDKSPIIEIDPGKLETSQKTLVKKDLDRFLQNPRGVNKALKGDPGDEHYLHPALLQTNEGIYVYDGNHRCSAALKLGMKIKAHCIDMRGQE